jgi:hypothetical protein
MIKCDIAGHYRRVDGKAFAYTGGKYYINWEDLVGLVTRGYKFREPLGFNEISIFNEWYDRTHNVENS